MPINKLIVAGLIVTGSTTAYAQQIPVVGDLAAVNADTIMLQAQKARQAAQQALNEGQNNGVAPVSDVGLPALVKIIAINGTAVGTWIYPGNVKIEQGEGEHLPGGYTIAHLWADKLSGELRDRQGKIIPIGVSIAAPELTKPATAANGPAIPGYMRVPGLNGG